MSHELRTPLNAILGFTQLLEMDDLAPEQRESTDYIMRAGRHLLNLINEVLDVARIEESSLPLSLEPISVYDTLEEGLDLVRPLAAQSRVEIEADIDGICGTHVCADRQRLQQVMLNLLSNAIKYNREGGRVEVACRVEGERLCITVADNGIGIAHEKQARLFSPFERLGAEYTNVEGTGLGLVLSKRLVEAMYGEIGFTSEHGVGSTFWVSLPLAEDQAEQLERKGAGPLAPMHERFQSCTVLYIEDNLSNLRLVERVLEHHPEVRLLSTMQGGMGVEMARQHQPDLIMLDLHLLDMAGDEALRHLRADPKTRHIPVIIVSADATPRRVEELLGEGAIAYLTKPLDVSKFLDLLEEVSYKKSSTL